MNKTTEFIGKSALYAIKEAGVTHRLAGIKVGGKRVDWYPADFYHVLDRASGDIVGYVTSMWYSPVQCSNIALAFLPVHLTTECTELAVMLPDVYANQPGVAELATVVAVPFKTVDSAKDRTGMKGNGRKLSSSDTTEIVHQEQTNKNGAD